MKRISAHFINVDLDLKSATDLSPLLKAWTNRVIPIHVGRYGRRYWVRCELTGQAKDPARAILGFCNLIRRLTSADRALWKKASPKEFDVGVQAGLESRAAEWLLDSSVIGAVRDVGARIRLTVYSPLSLVEEEQRVRRRARAKAGGSAGIRIARVSVNAETIRAYLTNGLMISVPIASSWRLSNATRAARAHWQLIGNGRRVYWPDIDEDLSVESLLDGVPLRQLEREGVVSQEPADQALQRTSRTRRKSQSKRRSGAARR